MIKRIKVSHAAVMIIMVLMTGVSSNLNWSNDHWKTIIISDGKGYYAYLPAIFIYHDLNFGFFDKIERVEYFDPNNFYDYRSNGNGKVIDKYYCGTALAEMPFFMAAHAMSSLAGQKADGYSILYQIFINVASLFYLLAGLLFLNATLSFYQVREWDKVLVLFAAVFGTNLFYYTVREPAMSHIFSFAFIAGFLYYSKLYFTSLKTKYLPVIALALGIICLIRPVNGLVILALPFMAGSYETFRTGIVNALKKPFTLAGGLLIVLAVIAIQPVIYKLSTGIFFVDSYIGEGFSFSRPEMINILFSYKKGLFLYTPLYLVSLAGGYFLWKASKFSFFAWFGFFILITYVFSSWWCWYYGGSFSSRVYVEFLPLFMILLGLTLTGIRWRKLKVSFTALIFLLIVICQIQTYQYRYYQIHWSEMTKEKYWDVFLRIDKLIK